MLLKMRKRGTALSEIEKVGTSVSEIEKHRRKFTYERSIEERREHRRSLTCKVIARLVSKWRVNRLREGPFMALIGTTVSIL